MTKEELIKLSRENLRKSKQGSLCECYDEAFIKGYQLSEKRIAELEQQVEKMKADVLSLIKDRMNDDIDQNIIERLAEKWEIKKNERI